MSLRNLIDPLLVACSLLLGVYLLITAADPTTGEREARPNNVLPAYLPDEISELRWEHPESFRLVRDTENNDTTRYFLGTDGGRLADPEVVRQVLSSLDLATWKRKLGESEGASSHQFGFDAPQTELRILAGPRSYRLLFGASAKSPTDSVYLRVEGTNVSTATGAVSRELLSQVEKTKQEFLGGVVFPLARSETTALTLASPDQEIRLVATERGFMLSSLSEKVLADRTLVDLVFFHLARAKVDTYLQTSEKEGTVWITQEGGDGVRYRAELGGPCPSDPLGSIVARRTEPDPFIGCVTGSVLAAFQLDEERLKSRSATIMNADEIDHITVKHQGRTLDVIRAGDAYKLLSGQGALIPLESGDELFEGIASARLVLLSTPPSTPTKLGDVTLKGHLPASGAHESRERSDFPHETTLEIYQNGDDALLLKREADGAWLEVPASHQWLFSAHDEWARDRKISDFSEQDITRVEITLPAGAHYEVTRSGDGFLLFSPEEEPADPTLTRQLFAQLADLSALRFITPARPRPESGLLEVSFEVTGSGAPKQTTLWVGGRIRGGYLAWSTAIKGTFVLPLGAKAVLETPLVDRRDFHIDPDDQEMIEITSEGRTFRFERQAGVLRAEGGEAHSDMVEPLVSALRAIAVVSAAGSHGDSTKLLRGPKTLTIKARRLQNLKDPGRLITLHFGSPAVWQGVSTRVGWIEGQSENYLVSQASLTDLMELL